MVYPPSLIPTPNYIFQPFLQGSVVSWSGSTKEQQHRSGSPGPGSDFASWKLLGRGALWLLLTDGFLLGIVPGTLPWSGLSSSYCDFVKLKKTHSVMGTVSWPEYALLIPRNPIFNLRDRHMFGSAPAKKPRKNVLSVLNIHILVIIAPKQCSMTEIP